MKKLGAVILVGGESSRMGTSKSRLTVNGMTFVEILVSKFESRQIPIVIVDAEKEIPWISLPNVTWLTDKRDGFGPLEGVRVGLEYLHDKTEFAFVSACDAPLLRIELVEFLASQIENYQAVIPQSATRIYGLTAVYRTDAYSFIESRILAGENRLKTLSKSLHTKLISLETLRAVDPELVSFRNINTPDDYQELVRASYPN